jgi:hypothetical protein
MKGYKTIIFAALVAAFGAAVAILPTLQSIMTPELYALAFVAISMVNAVLRAVTDTGVFKADSAAVSQ